MPVSINTKGRNLYFKPIINEKKTEEEKIEEKKEESLEPLKSGKGISELQDRLSNLKFNDTPIVNNLIKGARKKRNISFTY